MKKRILIFLVLLIVQIGYSQFNPYPEPDTDYGNSPPPEQGTKVSLVDGEWKVDENGTHDGLWFVEDLQYMEEGHKYVCLENFTETYFVLMNDLDFNKEDSYRDVLNKPIYAEEGFPSINLKFHILTFVGNNKTIRNLYINDDEISFEHGGYGSLTSVALFGRVGAVNMSNLTLESAEIISEGGSTSPLIGYISLYNRPSYFKYVNISGTVRNTFNRGPLEIGGSSGNGTMNIGGIAGTTSGEVKITDSIVYLTLDILDRSNPNSVYHPKVGGFLGECGVAYIVITRSSTTLSLPNGSGLDIDNLRLTLGGFIGRCYQAYLGMSYAYFKVAARSSHEYVGGLIGNQWGLNCIIEKCYSTGWIYGNHKNKFIFGGLVGKFKVVDIKSSYSKLTVSVKYNWYGAILGGLLGDQWINGDSTIYGSYASGDLIVIEAPNASPTITLGGLVANFNKISIRDSVAFQGNLGRSYHGIKDIGRIFNVKMHDVSGVTMILNNNYANKTMIVSNYDYSDMGHHQNENGENIDSMNFGIQPFSNWEQTTWKMRFDNVPGYQRPVLKGVGEGSYRF
ncbi:MAG: hypothetical protein HRT66_04840 [Flavobacteriaceae bacterium]|nr:hypothetical protein [Flavobacteriaceae bacterium]